MSVLFCIVSLKKLKLDLSISILLLALHVSCTLQIPVGYIISSVLLLKEKENIPEERNFVAQNEVIRWEKAEKGLISGRNQWPWKKMPPSKTPRFVSREKKTISSLYLQLFFRDCAPHKRNVKVWKKERGWWPFQIAHSSHTLRLLQKKGPMIINM